MKVAKVVARLSYAQESSTAQDDNLIIFHSAIFHIVCCFQPSLHRELFTSLHKSLRHNLSPPQGEK